MDSNRATKLRSRSRSRGGCAAAKSASMYDDDVFGSPALSPSEEDYIEIFGGFHGARGASGIPVLDLPPVDEKEALFDFRLFDYSEVFGGFEGLDYVVPFQELFRRSNGGYVSSSDDAWTNVETDCLSEEWDGSPYSSKCKSYGNESNQQSIEDGKQFHMSYQRKHQMNEEGVSNTAHVAPVRAVPGYAFVIDQIAPSQKIESQNSQLHIDGDDDKLIKRGKREEELSEKLASAVELEKGHVRNGSQSNEMYVTISEINLRTLPSDGPPPSRPPPIFDASYGNSREATSSLKATCNSKCFSRSTSGNDSPPFVDVELDARISAAESAASVTESVMNSQAQPKTIKENLQLKNVVMSQVSVCPKDEAKCNVAAVGKSHNSCKDQEDDTCTLKDYAQHPSRKESYSGLNNAQSLPDVMGLNPMLNLMGKNKSKQSWSSEESCEARLSGEWSKVPEFIELVRYGKTKTSQQENGDDIIVQNRIMKECVKEEKRVPKKEKINQRVYIATNKLEDHVKISEAVSKMSKQDKNYKEFHVSLQVEQCEEVERQVNEEDPQMEDDIFIEIMKNEHETEKELNKIKRKVKLGDDEERMEDPRKIHEVGPTESFVTAEDDGRVNDDLSIGPGEIDIRENCQQAIFLTTPRKSCEIELENLNEQTLSEVRKEAHNEQQNGRVMKSNIEQERREPCFKETFEDIKKRKKYLKESHVSEETKRKTKEIFEKEENERRKKEEEYVAKLMEASDNEADEMLKEALEEVNKRILMEDLERTEREKIMNMIAERTSEKQPDVRKVTRGGPIMMTGSRRSSNLTSEIDIGIEATNLRSYQAEKLKEENIFNSECDSEQENAKSTLEFITVVGKKSNYNQASDGGVISEYIPGAGTNEQLSDAKENINLVNGTSMSTNASGEAALHSDQIGVKRNNKLRNMAPDSTNLQKNVKVGKVTMPEKAQAQTKAPPHDDVNTDKDKLAQKADGEMTNSKGSQSTKPQMSGGRKQTQNQSHQSKTNQIVGGKEKCRKDNSTPEEREKLERLRKEREIELERLREMEEEWEREREREKDRVAFESVNRNFQEKAYPGLRERAAMDKASAEPRQKDLAKARERLEKSYSDKISMEAKMRQEQSAVERANVEAREHADRSILSSAAMHPSTSIYTDKVEGVEGESTQRCKAILERHQRTAERAAKALAEKNTRDLIAQREQAERHRLAESLDVEVKRWSNGKQGNLRALLSTLQYILGPESGWQPVPLTGIITSAAVKKAYRKATLCVHPDKLQQRRATIQQKYICEKVFDLLKEAWNRFNSEEP